jgi:hypothetical protein
MIADPSMARYVRFLDAWLANGSCHSASAFILNVMSTMWDEGRPIYFRFAVSTAKSCNKKKVMCSWELSHKPFNLSTERLSDIWSITIFNNLN